MATSTEKSYKTLGIDVVDGPDVITMKWTKVTPGDILMKGDLLQYAEGGVQLYNPDSQDNLTFAGVCLTDSPGTDIEADPFVLVMVAGHLRVQMDSTGVVRPGVSVKLSDGPTTAEKNAGTRTTPYTFTVAQGEGIFWAMEECAASKTCKVYFNLFNARAANYVSGNAVLYAQTN